MHPSMKIKYLIKTGMTQLSIAEETGLDQSKISRISSGAIKNPRWDDSEVIDQLYAKKIDESRTETA